MNRNACPNTNKMNNILKYLLFIYLHINTHTCICIIIRAESCTDTRHQPTSVHSSRTFGSVKKKRQPARGPPPVPGTHHAPLASSVGQGGVLPIGLAHPMQFQADALTHWHTPRPVHCNNLRAFVLVGRQRKSPQLVACGGGGGGTPKVL